MATEALKKAVRPDEDAEETKKEGDDMDYEDKDKKKKMDGKYEAEKSDDLTEDDLEKSLAQLEGAVSEGSPVDRKSELLNKAMDKELEKSEHDELFLLLGGSTPEPVTPLADEITKSMDDNTELQKALDVSDFLQEQHSELTKSLGALAGRIEKSDLRQHEFNIILAKAVANMGRLTQTVSTRLGTIEDQPVRAPKSKQATPLQKSFGGKPPAESKLSKSDIQDTLTSLIEKSVDAGQGGAVNGYDLINESSKFEQLNTINPAVMAMVQKERSVH